MRTPKTINAVPRAEKGLDLKKSLLVVMGSNGVGCVVHDAAPSANHIERAGCHIVFVVR